MSICRHVGLVTCPEPLWSVNNRILSAAYGPRLEEAGKQLTNAVRKGALPVYVRAAPRSPNQKRAPRRSVKAITTDAVIVPPVVLKRLIAVRGYLPDRAVRPSLKTVDGDLRLYNLLCTGGLFVDAREFENWYRSEKAKGRWQSQDQRKTPAVGRPTRQNKSLEEGVIAHVQSGHWHGKNQSQSYGDNSSRPAARTSQAMIRLLALSIDCKSRLVRKTYYERSAYEKAPLWGPSDVDIPAKPPRQSDENYRISKTLLSLISGIIRMLRCDSEK